MLCLCFYIVILTTKQEIFFFSPYQWRPVSMRKQAFVTDLLIGKSKYFAKGSNRVAERAPACTTVLSLDAI